nr:hypothetical protein [Candidatus Njordarchaeota archaeon]
MEKKGLVALALLAIVSMAPFIAATSASAHQNNAVSVRTPDDEHERNVSIQVRSESEVEIDSEFQDHIGIHFYTADGISLKLHYNSHTNTTESEFELHVEFISLVELVGNNTVGTIDLTKVEYSSPQVTNITSSSGVNGYRIESHSVGTTYTFQIVAYIYTKFAIVNNTNLEPTQMKITIVIENFPYTLADSTLGLVVDAHSQAEIHTAESASGDEGEVEVETEVTRGYFSWSNSALVDNVARPVNSSVSKQEDYQITLIYPHGTKIVHDPILGVGPVPATSFLSSPLFYITLGAAILAVALVFAIRRARPRIQNSATHS